MNFALIFLPQAESSFFAGKIGDEAVTSARTRCQFSKRALATNEIRTEFTNII